MRCVVSWLAIVISAVSTLSPLGGSFVEAEVEPAAYVARWDGAAWREVGGGMDSRVEALAVFQWELVAAGLVDHAGGVAVHHVTRWDGAMWRDLAMGTGPPGPTTPTASSSAPCS